MPSVLIVGGGIAGLAAAYRLSTERPDLDVEVLESAPRAGGKLLRQEVGGLLVDVGAEAMLARRPEGLRLVDQLRLGGSLIHPKASGALVRSYGGNHPLPARTLVGVPADPAAVRASGVLSASAMARLEQESTAPPMAPLQGDVSVGDLVAERLGGEVVDRLVDPLLGGVYAGRARDLSLQAAIPALAGRLARQGGSLIAAAADLVAAAEAPAARSSTAGPPGGDPVFASLGGGLAGLAETLADRVTVRTGVTVREIRRVGMRFDVLVGSVPQTRVLTADAVIVATPAARAARLLGEIVPSAVADLADIDTASMAIVTLAFDVAREPLALPQGTGMLIPSVEGLQTKAFTFTSQKWPGVGDQQRVAVLRGSLGRAGDTAGLQREDGELVDIVRRELAAATGVQSAPIDVHVQRWGGALPQYRVGHPARVERIKRAVAEVAGLDVCGASYDGVGVPACIGSGSAAADRIAGYLSEAAQWGNGGR
jgi:oxygen-dependent protoporphyrinogen oxidase